MDGQLPALFLVHWDETEAEARAARLRADGWDVTCECEDGARAAAALSASPPDVLVVDLSRLPSHGRQTVLAVRAGRATRDLPVVFVAGTADKVARNGETFPRELHVGWDALDEAVRATLSDPGSHTTPPTR